MYRNLTFIRFPESLAAHLREVGVHAFEGVSAPDGLRPLEETLGGMRLKPIGPLEMSTRGWVSPYGAADQRLVQRIGQTIHLALGGEDKILPAAAINGEVARRIEAIEQAEGRRPGGRERKRIKDDLLHEMLPKALTKPYRLRGFIDTARGLLVVDTASRKAAEDFASALRQTLGSFPGMPLNAEVAPRAVLTNWIAGESMPQGMELGEEAELRHPMDGGAVARVQRQELGSVEVGEHLAAGKQVTRLGLVLGDHISFTLGDDLVARKFKLLDGALDKLEGADGEGRAAEIDAMAHLLVGEVAVLFDVLDRSFRISKAEG